MVAAGASATLLTGLVLPSAAQADPSDDAVAALKSASVYVGAGSPTIDKTKFDGAALGDVRVAVLPSGGPNPVNVAQSIGGRLDPEKKGLTVLVFEGHSWGTASTSHCRVGSAFSAALDKNRAELQSSNDVTATVADFAARVRAAPRVADGCDNAASSSGEGTGGGVTGSGKDGGSSHTGLIVVVVLVLGLIGWLAYRRRNRRVQAERELSDARAKVMPYYDRLASEVNTIDPTDNATARQAMADAGERFTSAGGQLATADSIEKYAQARRTTLEGLYAARTARTAVGLDPGPELPPIAESNGAQLDRPQEVTVQGQSFQGYPAYTPGAPYYYGGGYGVPGGWYGVPFWETLLVGSLLTGGFGGFGGGWGGYDAGYGTG
ncbi:MAG: hypothetical protein QOC66_395, partial [Pseudonocardiales bacterium]|nr:hypothetical protein [Pseudonocardiales bacterium]